MREAFDVGNTNTLARPSHACSSAVGPRNFLGRDEALDYETMSDLDWQEEPEDGEPAAQRRGRPLWTPP